MFVQPHDDAFNFGVDLYLTKYMYLWSSDLYQTSEDKFMMIIGYLLWITLTFNSYTMVNHYS